MDVFKSEGERNLAIIKIIENCTALANTELDSVMKGLLNSRNPPIDMAKRISYIKDCASIASSFAEAYEVLKEKKDS